MKNRTFLTLDYYVLRWVTQMLFQKEPGMNTNVAYHRVGMSW